MHQDAGERVVQMRCVINNVDKVSFHHQRLSWERYYKEADRKINTFFIIVKCGCIA